MKTIVDLKKFLFLLFTLLLMGNQAFCTGDTPPSFLNCPGDINTGTCQAVVDYKAVATAWPDPDITYVFSGATTASGNGSGSGSLFYAGTTHVTVCAANYLDTAYCEFNVTVYDTVAPVITCPGDQTIHCSDFGYNMPYATDNCGSKGFYKISGCDFEPFETYDLNYIGNWSDGGTFTVPLPFSFEYFGIPRSSVNVSTYGLVTFDGTPVAGNGCCSGQTLPNSDYENTIAATWCNMYSYMYYDTFGIAPNRVFVIYWYGHLEDYYYYYGGYSINIQLALYEGSNEIKIISINNQDNLGFQSPKTMGLNLNGSTAITVNGRNSRNWSATEECILFTPTTPVTLVSGIPNGEDFPPGTTAVTYSATDATGNISTCTFNVTYEPYLNGIVTVGDSGNYPNLTGAGGLFEAINNNGICGTLEALVISDLEEPGTFALNEIKYANPGIDNLYIHSDNDYYKYIYGNVNQAMIRFNNADYVTFSGGSPEYYYYRNFYIVNEDTTQAILQLTNGSSDNDFTGCYFIGNNTNPSSGTVVIGGTTSDEGNNRNTFLYNSFGNPYYTAGFSVNGFYSSGNALAPNTGNCILNNEFMDFDQKGIWITPVGNGSDWGIFDNYMYFSDNITTKANKIFIDFEPGLNSFNNYICYNFLGGVYGPDYPWICSGAGYLKGIVSNAAYVDLYENWVTNIRLSNPGITNLTGYEITGGENYLYDNYFGYQYYYDNGAITVDGTGTIIGILSTSPQHVYCERNYIGRTIFTKSSGSPVFKGIQLKHGTVYQNHILDITTTQTNISPTIYGIYNAGIGLTDPNDIYNNMIAVNSGSSIKPRIYGIYDQSAGIGGLFYHNSVYISGKSTSGYNTAAFFRNSTATTILYNNILVNSRVSNVLAKHYAVYSSSKVNWMSNYNDLYTASASLGAWGGTSCSNLTAWKMITGQDANSLNVMPNFNSSYDLHLIPDMNPALINSGGPLYTDYYDIDWDYRNMSSPTVGCDELENDKSLAFENGYSVPGNEPTTETNTLKIYPNPANSTATAYINLTQDNSITVEMYNMLGVKILNIAKGNYLAGSYNLSIDISNIPSGTYTIRYIINDSESIVKRVEVIK